MAIPVWARPYNRKAPHVLTARQKRYRFWLYEPVWYVFAWIWYGSLALLGATLLIGAPFIILAFFSGRTVPFEVWVLLFWLAAWFGTFGTITETMRYYFIEN